jgi:hypothetical protein
MPINDAYQVKFVCYDNNQVGLNIRHYLVTASTNPEPSRVAIADYITTQFKPLFAPMLAGTASFLGCSVRQIFPLPVSLEDHTTLAATVGTAGAIAAPKQIAGLIKLTTPMSGREGRGRVYMPFPSTSSVQGDGGLGPAYVTNLAGIGNAFTLPAVVTVGGGSITLSPGILHRKLNTMTLITGHVERSFWAQQHRRGDFGRVNQRPW